MPSLPELPTGMADETKAAAWDEVARELDRSVPGWSDPSDGVRPAGTAAAIAVRRLAAAAEWGDISTMKLHLRNEMAVVRDMLALEGLPPGLERALRAHLQRMARLV